MADHLRLLLPELIMLGGVVCAALMGLSPRRTVRDRVPLATGVVLGFALLAVLVVHDPARAPAADLLMPALGRFVRVVVCAVGIVLTMLSSGLIDRGYEARVAAGREPFEPLRAGRGEYHVFLLLSLMGVMLCCSANDLIRLFLSLELASLPTYVMVAMSRPVRRAPEAAMKYFFLGALASATMLYGFALMYGGTGTIELGEMREALALQAADGGISVVAMVGLVLALLGVAYKIAAAPMHFYAADVYEGAASPVTAFLAFVPKTAGMLAVILLVSLVGWSGHADAAVGGLPAPVGMVLWVIAVLTMTLGNIGALLQKSVKRMLAYSSIAHTGYMLIGVIAGPGLGLAAVLFYLLAYGIMNTAAFAVLAGLQRDGAEIESMEDLAGLRTKHPGMAVVMAVASGSLLGVPPLLGFWGKLLLFVAAVQAGHILLVVIAGLNTAISAWYYLRLVTLPLMAAPTALGERVVHSPSRWPRLVGVVTAVVVVAAPLLLPKLLDASNDAAVRREDIPVEPVPVD